MSKRMGIGTNILPIHRSATALQVPARKTPSTRSLRRPPTLWERACRDRLPVNDAEDSPTWRCDADIRVHESDVYVALSDSMLEELRQAESDRIAATCPVKPHVGREHRSAFAGRVPIRAPRHRATGGQCRDHGQERRLSSHALQRNPPRSSGAVHAATALRVPASPISGLFVCVHATGRGSQNAEAGEIASPILGADR